MGALLVDNAFLRAASNLIRLAEKTIYISTFKIEIITKPRARKLNQFFEKLFEKAGNGVDVRVIVNKFSNRGFIPYSNSHAWQILKNHKVKVRLLPYERLCHAKILLIDNKSAVIGSHNLSVKSCISNFEVSYYLDDRHTIEELKDLYIKIWETAKEA